jgi:glycosyltransferase involved in cell wall biosynthesis
MKPEISVVIPTDRFETIEHLIVSLANQTARGSIELVVVAPDADVLAGHEEEVKEFHSAPVVVAEIDSLQRARAMGTRAASADVVAFAESHSFPDPHWAEALIAAHRGPWAVVGPAMVNPHEEGSAGWAKFLVDYGRWVPPVRGGPVQDLPGHNSSYKRDVLLDYGPELERLLDAEWLLHKNLLSRGHALYLEPAATSRHFSVTRLIPSIVEWFYFSRAFATSRSRGWHPARRFLYMLGSPLIVLVRLRPVIAAMRRTGQGSQIPRTLPVVLMTLVGSAVGELVGYAVGGGEGAEGSSQFELHRERYSDLYSGSGDAEEPR